MNKQEDQDELSREGVPSQELTAPRDNGSGVDAAPENPLDTFLALAGGARYLWGLELHEAQGKELEQLLAEDLGEEAEE